MNRKLLHKFLIIALSGNLVASVIAQNNQHPQLLLPDQPAVIRQENIFFNTFPKWEDITKTCSHIYEKLDLGGSNKAVIVGGALTSLALAVMAKHYFDLRCVDIKVGKSELANASGKDFLFGSWNYTKEGYQTAKNLYDNKENVKKQLWNQVRAGGSQIHIPDDVGNRITPTNVMKFHLQEALSKEKIYLRKCLDAISFFTDVPQKIFDLVQKRTGQKRLGNSYLWYQDAAMHDHCINYFKTLNTDELNNFGTELQEGKFNSFLKKILFTAPGWSFWRVNRWRFGIWHCKASELYWRVYTRYLRTCALYEIVGIDETVAPEIKVLKELRDSIQSMISNQDNAYNDEELKLEQFVRLGQALAILKESIEKYNRNTTKESIKRILNSFMLKFKSINSFLLAHTKKPSNDTVLKDLEAIKEDLERIITQETGKKID